MKKYIKNNNSTGSDDLQRAIDCINEYNYYEFYDQYSPSWKDEHDYDGNVLTKDDNLSEVGLMFTTNGEDTELQVSVNLLDPKMLYYVDGQLIHTEKYGSLAELIDNQLKNLDWNDMYNDCIEYGGVEDYS